MYHHGLEFVRLDDHETLSSRSSEEGQLTTGSKSQKFQLWVLFQASVKTESQPCADLNEIPVSLNPHKSQLPNSWSRIVPCSIHLHSKSSNKREVLVFIHKEIGLRWQFSVSAFAISSFVSALNSSCIYRLAAKAFDRRLLTQKRLCCGNPRKFYQPTRNIHVASGQLAT